MFASIGHSPVNTDVLRMRGQLAVEQEIARHIGTILLSKPGGRLAAAAAKWLIANPERASLVGQADREAALAVNSVYPAISAMAGGWIFAEGDAETSVDEFDAAIRDHRTVLTE